MTGRPGSSRSLKWGGGGGEREREGGRGYYARFGSDGFGDDDVDVIKGINWLR